MRFHLYFEFEAWMAWERSGMAGPALNWGGGLNLGFDQEHVKEAGKGKAERRSGVLKRRAESLPFLMKPPQRVAAASQL